jgi:Protein of unknown function (DUF2380)
MRNLIVSALMLWLSTAGHAEPVKVVVFDLELVDTSLQGEVDGPRADEQRRLAETGDQLRKALMQSGRFLVIDIAPVRAAARARHLQSCGGCELIYAQQLGAELAITGVVQKVSNLILNMNIYVREASTGRLVSAMSADFRGNTDESWSRATSYLLRNRLLAPEFGVPQ